MVNLESSFQPLLTKKIAIQAFRSVTRPWPEQSGPGLSCKRSEAKVASSISPTTMLAFPAV